METGRARLLLARCRVGVFSAQGSNGAWLELEPPQNEHSCVKDETGVGAEQFICVAEPQHSMHLQRNEGAERQQLAEVTPVSELLYLGLGGGDAAQDDR